MKITVVTGNLNKLRELSAIAPKGLALSNRALELDEIQSLDLQKIVEDKLRRAYEKVGSAVIVEDVSAGLESINGLPGPFIKFFEQQLGRGALYTLSKRTDDRVTIRCIAAYYDGMDMVFGEGIVRGTITSPRGDNGFGFDCVVVPDGQSSDDRRTVAEMTDDEKNAISHRCQAFRSLFKQLERSVHDA